MADSRWSIEAPLVLGLLSAICATGAHVCALETEPRFPDPQPELAGFLGEAASHDRAYVILSVMENVSVTDMPSKAPTKRSVAIRITYTMYCLRDISQDD